MLLEVATFRRSLSQRSKWFLPEQERERERWRERPSFKWVKLDARSSFQILLLFSFNWPQFWGFGMSYLYLLLLLPSSIPPYLRHVSVKNGPTPVSFCLLSVFSNKQYHFTTNQCEKMSNCPSSIRCWDSNPQPLKQELSPITTIQDYLIVNDATGRVKMPRYFIDHFGLFLSTWVLHLILLWKMSIVGVNAVYLKGIQSLQNYHYLLH